MRKRLVVLAVLAATAVTVQADPLKLKIGGASGHGVVSFVLSVRVPLVLGITVDESVSVTAVVGSGATASEKATAIKQAVAHVGLLGSWRAVTVAGSSSLVFEHRVNGVWTPVDAIVDLVDTTGAGTALVTRAQPVNFDLDIDPEAIAVGTDAQGAPAFMSVAVTNTLTFTRAIQAGDTPEGLVNAFAAFLGEQETEGVTFERVGPTSLRIHIEASLNASLSWQVTDVGLFQLAMAGAIIGDGQDIRISER
jgi:hypothetical protein